MIIMSDSILKVKTTLSFSILLLLVLQLIEQSWAEEDEFSCHRNAGLFRTQKDHQRGTIIPRADITVKVDGPPVSVLCHFNDAIKAEDVFFRGNNGELVPHTIVNSSTIQAEISHSYTTKYRLQCVMKTATGEKSLCKQFVKAGYPPLDINEDDLHCISKNYESLNCTWEYRPNAIQTTYKVQYSIPNFTHESPCITNDASTMCYWRDIRKLRDEIYLHLHGANVLASIEYTHPIRIPEVVIPDKVNTDIVLITPTTVRVMWNLSFPIDVFLSGLYHKVDYRQSGEQEWQTVNLSSHKHPIVEMEIKRQFSVDKQLPLANMKYDFRVRLHTMAAPIQDKMWSKYDVLTIQTDPLPPPVAPKTGVSSFEVVEKLDKRDIYVNFQAVDQKLHFGANFTYKILAFEGESDQAMDLQPSERSNAFFKYPLMDFSEYRFKIWPRNEKGVGNVYSEVIIPKSDCMPKKTEFFTVIIRKVLTTNGESGISENNTIFSLYWVPSKTANDRCPHSGTKIDSYTIFWCRKKYENRCTEKLFWKDDENSLILKDFSGISATNISLYERNITGLPEGLYSFGVASVSGKYSSGIRWSSCIVDESDSPPAPTSVSAYLWPDNTVLLNWETKCSLLSAVPLGFNILYCKSETPDFGHCKSEVESEKVHSPEAKSLNLTRVLQPGTSYIFSITLLSYIGEGMQSRPVKVFIAEKVPNGPPMNFLVKHVTNTSATLTWELPSAFHRNGNITSFFLHATGLHDRFVSVEPDETYPTTYMLENLSPYTKYVVDIVACTVAGCSGLENRASVSLTTKAGIPADISNFALNIKSWRLTWDLKSCNSPKCEFEIQIPINDSTVITEFVEGPRVLNLYELDLNCKQEEMLFKIRAKGFDEMGNILYGSWTTNHKKASECPPVPFSMLTIILIVALGVTVSVTLLIFVKCGSRTIMNIIKDYTLKIEVPAGIVEIKDGHRDLNRDNKIRRKTSDVLLQKEEKIPKDCPPRPQRTISVSSEEMLLISSLGGEKVAEYHRRNLSGSSNRSSNQDSAVISESPSVSETEQNLTEMLVRQRITDHPYVQHSMLPQKLCEGYVSARSVPSISNLFQLGDDTHQQSTPNLANPKCGILDIPGAKRASTGYISMVDCEEGQFSPIPAATLPSLNLSEKNLCMPPYSRHGINPNIKMDSLLKNSSWPTSGYVTLAEASGNNTQNPPPPPMLGYVSTGDPFGGAKVSTDLSCEAYCKVGSQRGELNGLPQRPATVGSTSSPYVSVVDQSLHSIPPYINKDSESNISKVSPYVQLKDTSKWAHPVICPIQPTIETKRQISSAPPDTTNERNSLTRPGVTEVRDSKHGQHTPSLSKQSSGYVSQETLAGQEVSLSSKTYPDQVVMSPKRLASQSQIMPTINQQSSMV